MTRSNLCNYSDSYILVKGTAAVPNTAAAGATVKNANKGVIFKNCAPFTDCITKPNNTQVDHAKKNDVARLMYNLIDIVMLNRRH